MVEPVVITLMNWNILGFNNIKLTLTSSAQCFYRLTDNLAPLLAPMTQELIDKILIPELVAQWTFCEAY